MNILLVTASEGGSSSENCSWDIFNLEKALVYFELVKPDSRVLEFLKDIRDTDNDYRVEGYYYEEDDDDETNKEDYEHPEDYEFNPDNVVYELELLNNAKEHFRVDIPCFVDKAVQIYSYD